MKKGRTSANLEEGEIEEDETISIGMVHGQTKSSPKLVAQRDESYFQLDCSLHSINGP